MCGAHALCTAALHRPVCACEDGYEGNPYDKCTKVTRTSLVSGSRYIIIIISTLFVADAVPRWHEVQEEVRRVTRTSDQLMGRGDCVSMAVM